MTSKTDKRKIAILLALICLALAGLACRTLLGEDDDFPAESPALEPQEPAATQVFPNQPAPGLWRPSPGTTWQWQLTGEIDTSFDVEMYDIDLFDTPQAVIDHLHDDGRIVICYFSAGSWEEWGPDAGEFPNSIVGKELDGWPDERWLDISQLALVSPLMEARLDLAVQKRCDGVEPDNVTAYHSDTGFEISYEDQIAFNTWLASAAHQRGLSIGLKNDLEQVPGLEPHFDWALNEECFQYDECEALLPFIQAGKAVFGVEYEGEAAEFRPQANALNFDWLQKKLDLDPWRIACR